MSRITKFFLIICVITTFTSGILNLISFFLVNSSRPQMFLIFSGINFIVAYLLNKEIIDIEDLKKEREDNNETY